MKIYGTARCLERDGRPLRRRAVRPALGGVELEPYLALTTNTIDTARNAEPAGSRHTPTHWQVDLNYTQNVR